MLFRGSYKGSLVVFSFSDLTGWDDCKVYVRGQIPLDEVTEISQSVGRDKDGCFIFIGDTLEMPIGIFNKVIPFDKDVRHSVYCQNEGGKVWVSPEFCKVRPL